MIPTYKADSLPNLMSTMASHIGAKSMYSQVHLLKNKKLKKKVLLVVIDGLGYNWLQKHGKNSFLYSHCIGSFKSVFPSTTAAAMTCIHTGIPAQQHALTGWFINFRELGILAAPLPFYSRAGGVDLKEINFSGLFSQSGFASKIKRTSTVGPTFIKDSPFNQQVLGNSTFYGYTTPQGFVRQTVKAAQKSNYTLSYWPFFDAHSHHYGKDAQKTIEHFWHVDALIEKIAANLKNTTLIVTADHGMIDANHIKLPKAVKDCLATPLFGEGRAPYLNVRSDKLKQFNIAIKKIAKYCTVHNSADLIKKNYFGLGKAHKELLYRIGTHTLIMKKNYALYDELVSDFAKLHKGVHGGVSEDEMLIPLIIL